MKYSICLNRPFFLNSAYLLNIISSWSREIVFFITKSSYSTI